MSFWLPLPRPKSWRPCAHCGSDLSHIIKANVPDPDDVYRAPKLFLSQMSDLKSNKRQKVTSVAHQIPTDLLAEIALYLDARSALLFALTSTCVFLKIRSRYIYPSDISLQKLLYEDPLKSWYDKNNFDFELPVLPHGQQSVGYKHYLFCTFSSLTESCGCLVDLLPIRLARSIKHLHIKGQKDKFVLPTRFPPFLKELNTGAVSNVSFENSVEPLGISELIFGNVRSISSFSFAPSLRKLILMGDLEHLKFNIPLPPLLKHLEIQGYNLNDPLVNCQFPPLLETLILGGCFDQPIEDIRLPDSLRVLQFSDRFNHPISRLKLPPNIEYLSFGYRFNQSIPRLPPTLKHFSIEMGEFHHSFSGVSLPDSLEYLEIPYHCDEKPLQLPRHLETLVVYCCRIHGFKTPLTLNSRLKRLAIRGAIRGTRSTINIPSMEILSFYGSPTPDMKLPESCKRLILESGTKEQIRALVERPDFPSDCQEIIVGRGRWGDQISRGFMFQKTSVEWVFYC